MVGISDYKHVFICTYSSCASGFYRTYVFVIIMNLFIRILLYGKILYRE